MAVQANWFGNVINHCRVIPSRLKSKRLEKKSPEEKGAEKSA